MGLCGCHDVWFHMFNYELVSFEFVCNFLVKSLA